MNAPVRRRDVLTRVAGFAGLTGVVAALGLTGGCGSASAEPVLAAGEPGGFYEEFGDLLAAVARDAGLPMRPVTTGGSVDNVTLVADGRAALGLSLGDVVGSALAGVDPFPAPVGLLAIGRVYQNYLQLAVRAESPVATLGDLTGRVVSLGASGSGAALAARRLLELSGVRVRGRSLGLVEAAAALAAGEVDAMLWSGGVPTPTVDELARRRPLRLLPLAEYVAPLGVRHGPAYSEVAVPAGVYGGVDPVATVGVGNLLVGTVALSDAFAGGLTRLLVERASELVPGSALGTQYLDPPALIDTGDVPLHPGAAEAYRALHG